MRLAPWSPRFWRYIARSSTTAHSSVVLDTIDKTWPRAFNPNVVQWATEGLIAIFHEIALGGLLSSEWRLRFLDDGSAQLTLKGEGNTADLEGARMGLLDDELGDIPVLQCAMAATPGLTLDWVFPSGTATFRVGCTMPHITAAQSRVGKVRNQRILDYLRSVPLFASLSNKELRAIAKAVDELTLPPGEVLTDQGQRGGEAFVIVSGSATVRRNGKKVATLGPGAFVGELSLLDNGPRTASVTTDQETTVFKLDERHFGRARRFAECLAKAPRRPGSRVRELEPRYYG